MLGKSSSCGNVAGRRCQKRLLWEAKYKCGMIWKPKIGHKPSQQLSLHPFATPGSSLPPQKSLPPLTESRSFPPWPPEWPEIADSIDQAVRRGDWGRYRGQATDELTQKLADLAAAKHCRLVSSGSLGIEIALRGAGVAARDRVALCGYDYPGNFRAIELIGARPVLVDADPASYSADPNQLEQIPENQITAVLVSHLYGIAAQIDQIRELCTRRGWRLIEDACQTPGMDVAGRPAGAWGDVGVMSFGGSKPLTAGNGGALLTSDAAIASRLAAWIDRPSDSMPMSELQAAALLPQLSRLQDCNRARWATTVKILDRVPWFGDAIRQRKPTEQSTFYKLAFQPEDRQQVLTALAARGLPVGSGYRSMHRSSDRRCDKIGPLQECQKLGEQLCLLDHSVLLSAGRQREHLIELLGEEPAG